MRAVIRIEDVGRHQVDRLADGPDEVHRMQLARRELGRYTDSGESKPT